MTLHGLINTLTEELKLTPKQQFRVTAKIKRLIHAEKADVFYRYSMYSQGLPIFEDGKLTGHGAPDDPFLHEILTNKAEQHREMAEEYTDEELVTWDVGTHKFRQEKPPCFKCGKDPAASGYMTYYKDGKSSTVCRTCAEASGEWQAFHEEEE